MPGTRTETKYTFVVVNHSITGVSYKLALVMGTCHLPLQDAAAAADLQYPLKEAPGIEWK